MCGYLFPSLFSLSLSRPHRTKQSHDYFTVGRVRSKAQRDMSVKKRNEERKEGSFKGVLFSLLSSLSLFEGGEQSRWRGRARELSGPYSYPL